MSSFELIDLEIVGFADRLSESFVPLVVPPVFRLRDDPDRIVMPPFRIEGERVEEAMAGFKSDFERAIMRGQATRLERVIAARPGYRLWIDERLEPHYEPGEAVAEKLRRLARSKAREAQRALAEGRLAEATRLAQTSINADDGCLNAVLVKALVHQLEGDHDSVEVLTDIAETILPEADFQAWVDFFAALVIEQSRRTTYAFATPRFSSIAEPPASYVTRPADTDWPGAGGWIDEGVPYSDREIAEALQTRYRALFEIQPDLEDELLVM